jgi:hypothetical protein
MSSSAISEKLKRDMERQFGGNRSLEGTSRVPFYKVDAGAESHAFRVLPGEFGESKQLWFIGVQQHWVKGPKGRIPLYCPRMDEDGVCVICDKVDEFREMEVQLKDQLKSREVKETKSLFKQTEGELKLAQKVISVLSAKASYMLNILDRDDLGVKVYSAPKSVFARIMGYFSEDGPEIFDVDSGHDFRIKKKKKGRSVDYTLELVPKATPLRPTESGIQDILDKRHDIEGLIKFEDEDKLEEHCKSMVESIISGNNGDDDDDDDDSGHRHRHSDDDDSPRKRASRDDDDDSPRKRASRDDDDDSPRKRVSRDEEDDDSPRKRVSRDEEDDDSPRKRSEEDDDDRIPMGDKETRSKPNALLSRMNRLKDED